jgi:hypothetical protein
MPTNNEPLRRALTEQKAIGWDNCMRGFISKRFQQIVNQDKANPLTAFESVKWTTQVIKLQWYHELDHWRTHNEAVHGATNEEK